jgi:hypothetical protein
VAHDQAFATQPADLLWDQTGRAVLKKNKRAFGVASRVRLRLPVEERRDHRKQPLRPVQEAGAGRDEVGGAGEHGELRLRQSGEVTHHPASAQPEELDRVLEADAVGVSQDDQGRRGDRLESVKRVAAVLAGRRCPRRRPLLRMNEVNPTRGAADWG